MAAFEERPGFNDGAVNPAVAQRRLEIQRENARKAAEAAAAMEGMPKPLA